MRNVCSEFPPIPAGKIRHPSGLLFNFSIFETTREDAATLSPGSAGIYKVFKFLPNDDIPVYAERRRWTRKQHANYQSGNDSNADITSRWNTVDKEFTRETYYADEYSKLSSQHGEEILSMKRTRLPRLLSLFHFPIHLAQVTTLNFNFHTSSVAV